MELIYNQCYDDGYLGDIEVECDCRHIIFDTCRGDNSVVECPKCGRKGIIRSSVKIWMEELKEDGTQTTDRQANGSTDRPEGKE